MPRSRSWGVRSKSFFLDITGSVSSDSASSVNSGNSVRDEDEYECLEVYGHPVLSDCDAALDQIKNLPDQELPSRVHTTRWRA